MNNKITQIKNFIIDKDKKRSSEIIKEVIELWRKDEKFPLHYFTRLVYKEGITNYKEYLNYTTIKKLQYSDELHKPETILILKDKSEFDKFCIENKIPSAITLGFNIKEKFYINNESNEIYDIDSFIKVLYNLVNENNINGLFLKPIDGGRGRGCYRIESEDLKNIDFINSVAEIILSSSYIIQENISQHKTLNEINPYSVNTLRIDTYITDNNSVEILSGLMRIGRKGSVVDNNGRSGGFFVPINLENGQLSNYGLQFLGIGNRYVYEHPDTKVRISGYKIPYFDETKMLIEKATLLLGDRLVGWDVAITDKGPILIEGNSEYHIGMQDMAYGGYKGHPIFREILRKHNRTM